MDIIPDAKEKNYWGRQAAFSLFKDLNCAQASLEVFQDMADVRDDELIKGVTGLEGGCVACGSTCGVVTGGALGIAMGHESEIAASGLPGQKQVLRQVSEYVDWFAGTYGSSLCRERSKSDFYSTWSQLKYFLTFYRLFGCFRHIRGAMRYLYEGRHQSINAPENIIDKISGESTGETLHCARAVLEKIRDNTGIGSQRLEHLSFVFDGGVGLSGGLCGALAGAVMGINLFLGLPVRQASFWKTVKTFSIGHVNLLVDRPFGKKEPFKAGKQVLQKFKEMAGSTECRTITGKEFLGWDDFQAYISGADPCRKLMDAAAKEAIGIIREHQ